MAFKAVLGASLGKRRGDRDYQSTKLYDAPYMKKGNGIHIDVATSGDVETVITALEPLVDGVYTSHRSAVGVFVDDAKVIPADTTGDASTKNFKVSFSDTKDTCNICIHDVLNTKVADVATWLKSQTFKDEAGTTLSVSKVEVAQTF